MLKINICYLPNSPPWLQLPYISYMLLLVPFPYIIILGTSHFWPIQQNEQSISMKQFKENILLQLKLFCNPYSSVYNFFRVYTFVSEAQYHHHIVVEISATPEEIPGYDLDTSWLLQMQRSTGLSIQYCHRPIRQLNKLL